MDRYERGITVEQIKAMFANLADKVEEEGKELYDAIKAKIDAFDADVLKDRLDEVHSDLLVLVQKVNDEGKEIINAIEERFDALTEVVQEEIAEYKEVGPLAWVKANPMYAAGIGAVILVAILIIVL